MRSFPMVDDRRISLFEFEKVVFLEHLLVRIEFFGLAVVRDEKEVKLFESA
jgi:hypothetical protein